MANDDNSATTSDDAPKQKKSTVAVNAALIDSVRESTNSKFANIEERFDNFQKALDILIAREPAAGNPSADGATSQPPVALQVPLLGLPVHTDQGPVAGTSQGNQDRRWAPQSNRFHPYGHPSQHAAAQAPAQTLPAHVAATGLHLTTGAPNIPAGFLGLAGRSALPTMGAQPYTDLDPAIDEKVKAILESTAHNLTLKGKKICYPHNYVLRGEKKEKVTLGTLTLAEHCWGLMRIIEDANLPPEDKPALVTHLDEVLEDARDCPWPNVRRWSEEVFTQIGGNRIQGGWSNDTKIQLLRVTFSRNSNPHTSAGASVQANSGSGKGSNSGARGSAPPRDQLKGGPPCKEFNAGNCTQQSGHMVEGIRRPHICSYCIAHFSSIHTHSEKDCEIKKRQGTSQGKRQSFRD